MAAVINETPRSQEGAKSFAAATPVREYVVLYQTDLAQAVALVEATAPVTWTTAAGSVDRKSLEWRNLGGPDLWLFTVHYGSSNAGGGLRPDQFTFRVLSKTVHITQSFNTQQRIYLGDGALSGTNLTVDADDNTLVLPDGYSPDPLDTGKVINITGGAGFTVAAYTISAVQRSTADNKLKWKLSASPAAVSTTNGVWNKPSGVPSGTNLTVDNVTNTVVKPDVYLPASTDLGKTLVVYDGTGWTIGSYTITAVAVGVGGSWGLSASPAAVSTAGGYWYLVGTAPDLKGAIGQSLDSVQGADAVVPSCEFTYSQSYSVVGDAEVRGFRALVGFLNSAPFRGYPAGTLMYLGCEPTSAQGTLPNGTSFTPWALAHNFRYEPHQTNVRVGTLTLPVVPAHSHVWAKYLPAVVPKGTSPANIFAVPPSYIYIEQVAKGYADFAALGISL